MDLHISDLLQIYKPRQVKVMKRKDWIYKFIAELNKNRYEQDKLTLMRMAVTLKRWQDWELPVLWKLCETSNSFSKYFWWAYKMKPPIKKEKKKKELTLF